MVIYFNILLYISIYYYYYISRKEFDAYHQYAFRSDVNMVAMMKFSSPIIILTSVNVIG